MRGRRWVALPGPEAGCCLVVAGCGIVVVHVVVLLPPRAAPPPATPTDVVVPQSNLQKYIYSKRKLVFFITTRLKAWQ